VYFESVKTIDAIPDDPLFPPTRQPISGCDIEKVVLPCAFPDEMPSVLRIDANRPFAMVVHRTKYSSVFFLKRALAIRDVVFVAASSRRHEPDPVNGSIRRIAESIHLPMPVRTRHFER